MTNLQKILKCPLSGDDLIFSEDCLISNVSKNKYKIEDGIYRFLENLTDNQTSSVKEFYMEDPFPNYNSFDNLEKFIKKIENNYLNFDFFYFHKVLKFQYFAYLHDKN